MQELTFIESHDGRKMRINNAIALIVTMIRDANANNSQASTQFKIPRKASYVILELELVTGLHELQMHILQLKKCLWTRILHIDFEEIKNGSYTWINPTWKILKAMGRYSKRHSTLIRYGIYKIVNIVN